MRRVILYCDWCHRGAPEEASEVGGWDERDGELLCEGCDRLRTTALRDLREARVALRDPCLGVAVTGE